MISWLLRQCGVALPAMVAFERTIGSQKDEPTPRADLRGLSGKIAVRPVRRMINAWRCKAGQNSFGGTDNTKTTWGCISYRELNP